MKCNTEFSNVWDVISELLFISLKFIFYYLKNNFLHAFAFCQHKIKLNSGSYLKTKEKLQSVLLIHSENKVLMYKALLDLYPYPHLLL